MYMIPTRRKSGKWLVTLRPRFDLSRENVVALIAFETGRTENIDDLSMKPLSVTRVRTIVVGHLRSYGMYMFDSYSDDWTEEAWGQLTDWADSELRRLYPNWRQ